MGRHDQNPTAAEYRRRLHDALQILGLQYFRRRSRSALARVSWSYKNYYTKSGIPSLRIFRGLRQNDHSGHCNVVCEIPGAFVLEGRGVVHLDLEARAVNVQFLPIARYAEAETRTAR